MLLLNCLDWIGKDRNDYFAGRSVTVYYSPNRRKSEYFRGLDFFVVRHTQPHPRRSWMIWEEDGRYPDLIIELLSDSTADVDRNFKKRLYAETFRTPEYFWFDPDSREFQGFALVRGTYQPVEVNAEGRRWSEQLQLYLGVQNKQLRFFDSEGVLVPTPKEAATATEEALTSTEQALVSEQSRAEKLAEKLREL